MIEGPFYEGGQWFWKARRGDVEIRFTGRGPAGERQEVLQRIEDTAPPVAWAKQIHSAIALPAQAGGCGEGDAVYGNEPNLAMSVVTADCVPVLLAGPDGELAAVHAGWKGIVGGVIAETWRAIGGVGGGPGWAAWIGPAIGPCCYEVGEDVAERIAAASGPEVVVPGPGSRPHADLPAAVRRQLAEAGVTEIHTIPACTRCETERLYSYRRQGKGGGRNIAFIWRTPA
ncbi:MAG: polyphenol oxidase family protein [Acidobacteriota bacterium]